MRSQKLKFTNADGDTLVAQLEMPIDQKPVAFALFAHCFTCNKNLTAAKNISRSLAEEGFGVLRFDFSGLGESEGDFADTNFSSNVDDLISAAGFMEEKYQAPKLLVGHSLGGAAVYFAGAKLESVEAVASIGAPSSPSHVEHLLKSDIDRIEKEGKAEVEIAGRRFMIKKQFLDDLETHTMAETVKELRKPILLLHSPQDNVVGIQNAREIYESAMHPKSFISLDGADHLLSDKRDSKYAGQVIASWAERYIELPERKKLESSQKVSVQNSDGYTTDIKAGRHILRADEPEEVGGNDFGPTPYDLLLASLGSCTAMTLRMYAERKDWPVTEIEVHLDHSKEYAEDCENCDQPSSKVDKIKRSLNIEGDLSEKQKERLVEIADKCPVHRTLHGEVEVETSLND